MDDFEGLSDHFILRMYESIRNEVQADALAGPHLVGPPPNSAPMAGASLARVA